MSSLPPEDHQPSSDEVEETINEDSEVDEAAFESFPASDPPSWTSERVGPPVDDGDDGEGA